MVNATDVMRVIDAMDHLRLVNSVNKNVLLTKRIKMANSYAGCAPNPTRELWSGQNNPILPGTVEFLKRKEIRKNRRRRKRGKYVVFIKDKKYPLRDCILEMLSYTLRCLINVLNFN